MLVRCEFIVSPASGSILPASVLSPRDLVVLSGGIDIEVLIRNDQIWTGCPTNLPRNS